MSSEKPQEFFRPIFPSAQENDQGQLFLRDKHAWETAIGSYSGTDPLELWYNYICWYDYNIHVDPHLKFQEVLEKCLSLFENYENYKQDVRMIKLWTKYINTRPNPLHFYQLLYQRGIGTKCANFYIAWAHIYQSANAFKQAESVYNLGFQNKAEPFFEFQEEYTRFRSLSHRVLYEDNISKKRNVINSNEEHQQLTSSLPINKKPRFGNLSESFYNSNHENNQIMQNDFSNSPVKTSEEYNLKRSAHVISSSLNYIYNKTNDIIDDECQIIEDDIQPLGNYKLENAKITKHFPRYAKNNHETWKPLLCLQESYDPNRKCCYQKHAVYPGDENEYSPEEIRAKKWKMAQKRNIDFTSKNEQYLNNEKNATSSNGIYTTTIKNSDDNNEEIEASTISFSTDTNGSVKNKKITIKFRREPSVQAQNNNGSYNSFITDSSEQFKCSTSFQNRDSMPSATKNYDYIKNIENNYDQIQNGNYKTDVTKTKTYLEVGHSKTSTPKVKKVKKIKLMNNYEDPKYLNCYNNKDTISDFNYSKIHQTKSLSKNQFDDANLLLSLSNMHSNYGDDTNMSYLYEAMSSSEDSRSNNDLNFSFNENSYISGSNCSSPVRKLSQTNSKTSLPSNVRSLKKNTSNFSQQNDDSMCSFEQNSFFASEFNDDLKQRRLERALKTIETNLEKEAIDPFNTELCKAFLTKLDFPVREANTIYKLVNNTIPKLTNSKFVTLADTMYTIEKEVGRGSYGSVYKATNVETGAVVALKYQKPPNTWEVYIISEVRKRIRNYEMLNGFMDLSTAIIAPNASILITEYSVYGSLLDINNKLRQATKKVMNESLVMHFSSQILNIISHLHSCNVIHADIKPDNFLLMKIPNSYTHIPTIRLIDFGCAIDMNLFPEGTQFKKIIQTDGFTCTEMQEGRPWSYQTDLFCIAGTVHVMLFGEYMQLVKKFDVWEIRQKLPRYLKKQTWTEFFHKMLNIENIDHLPDLIELKELLDSDVRKMDSELQTNIRTLSNLLHKR